MILPAGTARMGSREYNVRLNSSPDSSKLLDDIPIEQDNGATVYVRDVAQVRDGAGVQTNIVRQNGIGARTSRSSRTAGLYPRRSSSA